LQSLFFTNSIDFTDILPLLHLFSILKYKILNLIYKIYFGGCG